MNKRYLVSLGVVSFFGCTTVILFVLAHSGLWVTDYAEVFPVVYVVNFLCLAGAAVNFFWQRAKRDTPKQYEDLTILEHSSNKERSLK